MLTLLLYDGTEGLKAYHDLQEIKNKIDEAKTGLFWLDLASPGDDEVSLLKESFCFHPLAIEDCLYRLQRPKIDEYDNYFFMVMHVSPVTIPKSRQNLMSLFQIILLSPFTGSPFLLLTASWKGLQKIRWFLKRAWIFCFTALPTP